MSMQERLEFRLKQIPKNVMVEYTKDTPRGERSYKQINVLLHGLDVDIIPAYSNTPSINGIPNKAELHDIAIITVEKYLVDSTPSIPINDYYDWWGEQTLLKHMRKLIASHMSFEFKRNDDLLAQVKKRRDKNIRESIRGYEKLRDHTVFESGYPIISKEKCNEHINNLSRMLDEKNQS